MASYHIGTGLLLAIVCQAGYARGILHTLVREQESDRWLRVQLVLLTAFHHPGLYDVSFYKCQGSYPTI